VHLSPNLGWHDYPLGPRLSEALGTPVAIDDDANCAALGEAWQGAGQGESDFVLLVVGSGIGAGVVLGGEVYHGAHDSAGEIGHVPLLRGEGRECGCGKRGCLEAMASGRSIAWRGRELVAAGRGEAILAAAGPTGEVSSEAVFAAAETGDSVAKAAVLDAADYLGLGMAIVADLYDPATIIVGGGLGLRGGWFMEAATVAMRRYALAQNSVSLRVVLSSLGDQAGLYGAGLLALRSMANA
jgi:glucokinase